MLRFKKKLCKIGEHFHLITLNHYEINIQNIEVMYVCDDSCIFQISKCLFFHSEIIKVHFK